MSKPIACPDCHRPIKDGSDFCASCEKTSVEDLDAARDSLNLDGHGNDDEEDAE